MKKFITILTIVSLTFGIITDAPNVLEFFKKFLTFCCRVEPAQPDPRELYCKVYPEDRERCP
jgi:hypothetical protein